VWTRTVWTYTDGTTETGYSVGKIGNTGATGAQGVSVSSVTPYYALVGQGVSAPAKPTTNPPSAPWSLTEPAYTSNTELYRVDLTVLSSGSWSYGAVSKVSSYTAASMAQSASSNFITDPEFLTNADGVKTLTPGSPSDDNYDGTLPETFTSYGRLTGNDNWTQNLLIRTQPGHTYRIEAWLKVGAANSVTNGFGLMAWFLTADGYPSQTYSGNGWPDTSTTLADWKHVSWDWKAPDNGSKPCFRPAIRNGLGSLLATGFSVRDVTEAVQAQAAADAAADAAAQAVADGVVSVVTEYAVGSSESTAPTSGWSTSTPARTAGTFIWSRTTTTKGGRDVRPRATRCW
jgi:hypothetical protein